jgi:hypothetical protein
MVEELGNLKRQQPLKKSPAVVVTAGQGREEETRISFIDIQCPVR